MPPYFSSAARSTSTSNNSGRRRCVLGRCFGAERSVAVQPKPPADPGAAPGGSSAHRYHTKAVKTLRKRSRSLGTGGVSWRSLFLFCSPNPGGSSGGNSSSSSRDGDGAADGAGVARRGGRRERTQSPAPRGRRIMRGDSQRSASGGSPWGDGGRGREVESWARESFPTNDTGDTCFRSSTTPSVRQVMRDAQAQRATRLRGDGCATGGGGGVDGGGCGGPAESWTKRSSITTTCTNSCDSSHHTYSSGGGDDDDDDGNEAGVDGDSEPPVFKQEPTTYHAPSASTSASAGGTTERPPATPAAAVATAPSDAGRVDGGDVSLGSRALPPRGPTFDQTRQRSNSMSAAPEGLESHRGEGQRGRSLSGGEVYVDSRNERPVLEPQTPTSRRGIFAVRRRAVAATLSAAMATASHCSS